MITIKYNELLTVADIIEDKRKSLKQSVKETDSAVFMLDDIWDSEMSDKYIREYQACSKSFNDVDRLLSDITKNMTAIARYCDHILKLNDK